MSLKYQLLQMVSHPNGQVRGRYAPSPSGVQHMGNIQTAVVAWLQARLAGGEFALRIDDIDTPRVKAGSAEQILDDLRWLGLDWDVLGETDYQADARGVYTESAQLVCYRDAMEKLQAAKLLYPCQCSRKTIQQAVGQPNSSGHYVYPGTCRDKNPDTMNLGAPLAWRFKVPNTEIRFDDMLQGKQSQNVARAWGDIIVRRRDRLFAYQLVSVVDDIHMGITDVVRGADLMDQTPGQIALFRALGAEPPRFWHLPLKTDAAGNKLSKRDGSDSLLMLREQGLPSARVIGDLAFELGLLERRQALGLHDLLEVLMQQA